MVEAPRKWEPYKGEPGYNIIHFIAEVIDARLALVRFPLSRCLNCRLAQSDVGVIVPDVSPSRALFVFDIRPHSEIWKGGPQETNHPINITDDHIRMFESDRHISPQFFVASPASTLGLRG